MKFNKLFFGLVGAIALSACSSEENVPNQPNDSDDEARFMSVAIRNTGMGTRAGGDQMTDADGNLYEEGLGGENAVNSIRFYFFGENGTPFPVAAGNLNYYDCKKTAGDDNQIVEDGSDMPNVEKTFKAILVLNPQEIDFSQLKSMVAVVNFENAISDNAAKSLPELQSIVGEYGISSAFNKKSENIPAMVMSSSVFGTNDQYEGCEVYIAPSKLKTSKSDAQADPVDVYVERVLAKVRMTAKWDKDKVTTVQINENSDNPVFLVQLKDKDGNEYQTAPDANGNRKNIYAKFIGWGLQTFTDRSYLFKNIGGKTMLDTWTQNLGAWWNDAAKHRSYWAVNPDDVQYKHATHTAAVGKIAWTTQTSNNGVTTTEHHDGDFFYTQENAADYQDGSKLLSNYNPDQAISRRTQAYVRALLVDSEGNPVSLAEWGNVKYTEEGVKTAMLASVLSQVWIKKTTVSGDGTTTTTEWETIPESMIHLVPAELVAGKANATTENSKRYLSYIQLKDGDYTTTEFYGADKTTALTTEKVNEILAGMPGAKVWKGGETYYYTDLRHLNPSTNGTNNVTKGEYGVVRNHIYEVELNTIFGLGTPVLIPDNGEELEIIPQKPTPDAYFLGARVNILSWRVVPNNVTLDW